MYKYICQKCNKAFETRKKDQKYCSRSCANSINTARRKIEDKSIFKNGIIGYSIDKDQQGNGYMKEAVKMALEYAFKELRLHRIEASALVENMRSRQTTTVKL